MNDDQLCHLVHALDAAVATSPGDESGQLHSDIEQAILRLHCLTNRLGPVAEASPYLAFLRRTTRTTPLSQRTAAFTTTFAIGA
jgi:hypothetical protein